MAVATATVAAAGIAAGASIYSSRQQQKSAEEANRINAKTASKVNYNPLKAARQVNKYMPMAFGNRKTFLKMRNASNTTVMRHLSGKVSNSTQAELSRHLLATGAVDLGKGAVDQLYGGYLGLTREELASQGIAQYQSLYGMYNNAVMGHATNKYSSNLNSAQMKIAATTAQANADANAKATMWNGIATTAGTLAGTIAANVNTGAPRGASGVTMPTSYVGGRPVSQRPPGL